ncbi:MAG: N-acetylmuramoyl-L-alanine amidase [Prevotella sp.]|nr:N-acetylmuramoyl-L-alanine amidase [Prevotella sp.]
MALKVQQQFLTPNKYSRPAIPLTKVTKIAVHYVGGAGSTAQNTRDYFESLKDQIPDPTGKWWLNKDGSYRTFKGERVGIRYVSSHFAVGLEGEVIQCIPTDEWSYCTNQANGYSISIETCHPLADGKFNSVTERSLIELTADLCRKFGLTEKDVIRHYDVTGKLCPLYYVKHPEAWDNFRAEVKKLLESGGEPPKEEGKSFLVKVLDSALNIRRYPSLTAPVDGVITDGGVYTVTETANGGGILWGKLKSGAGWISLGSKYVKRLEAKK